MSSLIRSFPSIFLCLALICFFPYSIFTIGTLYACLAFACIAWKENCRWILYQLSHKGSSSILECIAYPFLLQGVFLTQESNQCLLHCRWILYQLSYEASTWMSVPCLYILWLLYQASLVAQIAKNLPIMQETQVQSLGQEDLLGRKEWQHSPEFLLGEFHVRRSLVGSSP